MSGSGGEERRVPIDPDAPGSESAPANRGADRLLRGRWDVLAVIAAGGAVGSAARWSLTAAVPHGDGQFPWATWWANITGACALGVLLVFVLDVWPPRRYVRPFLGIGVLGGYTTYSTMMNDARTLAVAGQAGLGVVYLVGSVVTGLVAVWSGMLLARALVAAQGRRRRRRGRPSDAVRELPQSRDPDLDTEPDVRSPR